MSLKKLTYFFLFFTLLTAQQAISQGFNPYHPYGKPEIKRSPFRAFLNKFSLIATAGVGGTFYKTDLTGFNVYEANDNVFLLDNIQITADSTQIAGLANFNTSPANSFFGALNSDDPNYRILGADSVDAVYKGTGLDIPLTVILHFDFDRFRIGGGITYDFHYLNQMNPKGFQGNSYQPRFKTRYFRYFGTAGASFYKWRGWTYSADIQVGMHKYRSDYPSLTSYNKIFFNIGFPLEFEMSEYFFVYLRPSLDVKSYTVNLPEAQFGGNYPASINQNQTALWFQFGIRLKYPEVKRCPVKSCKTQLKHMHDGYEFRGQPIYKKQNPKIGELYPKLHRQKRKNRKKLGGGY